MEKKTLRNRVASEELTTDLATHNESLGDLLDIPEFLSAPRPWLDAPSRQPKKTIPGVPTLKFSKKPPQTKNYKKAIKVDINLADQAPQIGSGRRTIWANRGRSWAYLCDMQGRKAKIRTNLFDQLLI